MRPRELIVTHAATDFDALGAMVAARRLYPHARICLHGGLNRNVREFAVLHAADLDAVDLARVDLSGVVRLVVVETSDPSRLGRAVELLGREGVEVVLFDHHRDGESPPPWVTPGCHVASDDRALSTTMAGILGERGIEPTATEATALALGIHEDTGSLTHPDTGVRDVEALAWCMRHGAGQTLVAAFLRVPLSERQTGLLSALLDTAEPVDVGPGSVLLAATDWPEYVDAASTLASRMADLTDAGALVIAVAMGGRVVCVGRSRVPWFDVAAVLRAVGGDGHPRAASAHVRDESLAEVAGRLRAALPAGVCAAPTARDVMSAPAWFIDADESIDTALAECRRRHTSGAQVSSGGLLVGVASREHLDRAIGHGLGHAPLRSVLGGAVEVVAADAGLSELQRALVHAPAGRVPVVVAVTGGPYPVDTVLGIATRSDLLAALRPAVAGTGEQPPDMSERLAAVPDADRLWPAVRTVAARFDGVYLVGGAVRDLLLGEPTIDLDLAVEGDGVEFARGLSRQLAGRMHAHEAFQTAVVVAAGHRIDVASARSEHYEQPAALPVVEHTSIGQDLRRRDFTVNAMAVSVRGADFGRLLDPHGGRDDLRAGRLRVLHPLSFVEDPTRLFRAVRYQSRYGFAMEPGTLHSARSCIDMGLVADLSGARVRDELVAILNEPSALASMRRMDELRLAVAVHQGLDCGETVRAAAELAERLRAAHTPAVPAWRPRLGLICHALAADEVAAWLDALRFRRVHARAVGMAVVAPRRLADRIAAATSPSQVTELLSPQP
ncbi:MAG TPA: hypothetical protein VMU66_09900, partial [Gaiellales bacterium]|nr:hypothetical protein [Gaiellales bacterium]